MYESTHPLIWDDGMQQVLISLSNAALSCFAPLKTMKGDNFVPSAFPVRQTETRVFLCLVVFTVTVFLPVSPTLVEETISAQTENLSIYL